MLEIILSVVVALVGFVAYVLKAQNEVVDRSDTFRYIAFVVTALSVIWVVAALTGPGQETASNASPEPQRVATTTTTPPRQTTTEEKPANPPPVSGKRRPRPVGPLAEAPKPKPRPEPCQPKMATARLGGPRQVRGENTRVTFFVTGKRIAKVSFYLKNKPRKVDPVPPFSYSPLVGKFKTRSGKKYGPHTIRAVVSYKKCSTKVRQTLLRQVTRLWPPPPRRIVVRRQPAAPRPAAVVPQRSAPRRSSGSPPRQPSRRRPSTGGTESPYDFGGTGGATPRSSASSTGTGGVVSVCRHDIPPPGVSCPEGRVEP